MDIKVIILNDVILFDISAFVESVNFVVLFQDRYV